MEENSGISRRDVLRRGAVAGTAVLWAVPVVQVIGMSASHAEAASGGGSTPTPTPTATATPTPTPTSTSTPTPTPTSTPTDPTHVVPGPKVEGISFEQPPAAAPTATLPFTGATVPMTGAVALGAGLVATGVAAVAATHRRQQAGTVSTNARHAAADDRQPPTA